LKTRWALLLKAVGQIPDRIEQGVGLPAFQLGIVVPAVGFQTGAVELRGGANIKAMVRPP
jgi:hypothetical protein